MKLSANGLLDPAYHDKGYALPAYDIEAMRSRTLASPVWLHFGAGNIFRAYPAAALCRALSAGDTDKGVIVAESHDEAILDKVYHPYDELSLLVTLKADGRAEKQVVASVAASYQANPSHRDWESLRRVFVCKDLQLISFTVTEKGYAADGADFNAPQSLMARTARLLFERYLENAAPLALVSMDNISHNGERIKEALTAIARQWTREGKTDLGFQAYLTHPETLAYPWTMIDKITPRPDERVRAMLEQDGFRDTALTVTPMQTYAAPFVNAEETGYLVIEDVFPNGRPALEAMGFLLTDRETVNRAERMKVCACLNPVHTALAIFGCLLGYTLICDEMNDADLNAFVTRMAYRESLPVVPKPDVIDPESFLKTVLNVRLPNPFMPDSPQRIATDTSQKLAVRYGETIKAYLRGEGSGAWPLKYIPMVLAGWLRYLSGTDDSMRPFTLSPDPMLDRLLPLVRAGDYSAILRDEALFGVDLYQAGLSGAVLEALHDMSLGAGAVRRALKEACA